MALPKKPVYFTYRFLLGDGRALEETVNLDPETGRLINVKVPETLPAWTELEHHKCEHCPLKKEEHSHCPVAVNLSAVADQFSHNKSFEKVTCEVVSPERKHSKEIPLQEGLFGLFGLIMATSACPHMNFLRPMARFHLPFSSLTETISRSVGFYLFRQYFVKNRGGNPDFDLQNYAKMYAEVEKVNVGVVNRIRSIAKADADANSIVILDGFAKLLNHAITKNFKDFEKLFSPDDN